MEKKKKTFPGVDITSKSFLAVLILFGITFATVLTAGCDFDTSGLEPTHCCPTVLAFHSSYDWICPASCPGGGLNQIEYIIEFKDNHKELCDPEDLTISIRNVTDNTNLPSHFFSAEKGIYRGTEFFTLTKDTEFELNASTISGICSGSTLKTLTINVVDEGDFRTVVGNGMLTGPDMKFENIPIDTGPGVKIDKIENVNPFWIWVAKDTNPADLIFSNQNGTVYHDWEAAGHWSIGLTKEVDLSLYNQLPEPNLTVNVYLKCDCKSR